LRAIEARRAKRRINGALTNSFQKKEIERIGIRLRELGRKKALERAV